jgi:hypothetical protein
VRENSTFLLNFSSRQNISAVETEEQDFSKNLFCSINKEFISWSTQNNVFAIITLSFWLPYAR